MHTELKLHNVGSERLLFSYVDRRLSFALSHFREHIGRVTTRISATTNGRSELMCRITAELHGFGTVTAEAVNTDVYAAIDRCAGRLARRCHSKLVRPRSERTSRSSIRVPRSLSDAA
jgi:ribosomal subunit interface protein